MTLPVVRVAGTEFVTEDGQYFPYVGVSDFALFKRWLMPNGSWALVEPRLAEWRAIAHAGGYDGPIVLRVFRYAHPDNAFGIGDPWSYDFTQLTELTEFVGERGFYIDWTTGDSQWIIPDQNGPRGQQQHLNMTCAALAGTTNAFVETSNESFKNGQLAEHGVVPPVWGQYLRDSGAYGESSNWPVGTNLDFISYHGSRSDKGMAPWPFWIGEMWASALVLNTTHGKPAVMKEPIGFAEVAVPGRRSNNPQHAFRMGLVGSVCAGVTFHSQDGRDGDGLRPVQRACAEAFFAGIKAAISDHI